MYRGYVWQLRHRYGNVFLLVQSMNWVVLHEQIYSAALDIATIAHRKWSQAHFTRKLISKGTGETALAVDDIDWAIHEIVDEAAYATAVRAYASAVVT